MQYNDLKLYPKKSILTSRTDADITKKLGNLKFSSPVCAANMQSIMTPQVAKIFDARGWFYVMERMSGVTDVHNFICYAQEYFNTVSISVGIGQEWLNLLDDLAYTPYRIDAITIDIAHSFTDNILSAIDKIRNKFKTTYLIVGNGMTVEWVEWLEDLGVDCIKANLGNGSSCSTYNATGFRSDVSDLERCINAAKNVNIMADGGFGIDERTGLICVGDMVKALALGADFIMTGAAFKNCKDVPAAEKGYYGNASAMAKNNVKHVEGVHFQPRTNDFTVNDVIDYIEDSLKSAISYAGGTDLTALNPSLFQPR